MAEGEPKDPEPSPFQYVHSESFPTLLEKLALSLVVTTYQAGKVMVVRAAGGKLSLLLRSFEQPMGLALDERLDRMVVGTRRMLWTLRSAPAIAPQLEPRGRHDAAFVPRAAHVTGDCQSHEIVLLEGRPWFVNTLLSCLCSVDDEDYSFVPRWRPRFVDRLAGEDRCHLNGVAVAGGVARYATALGETNEAQGWKANKVQGGIVIDIVADEVVARGLCMPHSPRFHRGKLFVLDSGRGHLCVVDLQNGKTETVAALPGYARGLAFHGRFAFVGTSRIREAHIFGGLPIADSYDEAQRKCGVYAIDLQTGQVAAFLAFEAGCTELFDVQTLPGLRWPTIVGFQDQTLAGILIAPPAAWQPGAVLGEGAPERSDA